MTPGLDTIMEISMGFYAPLFIVCGVVFLLWTVYKVLKQERWERRYKHARA